MFCPQCGNPLSDSAQFCPACKKSLIEPSGMGTENGPAGAYGPPPRASQARPTQTSGLAITALVLGILSLCCLGGLLTGIPGLILGIIAISQIGKDPQLRGKGLAIGGIVTASVGIILGTLVLISIMLPALSRARAAAREVVCASQLKNIGQAITEYRNKHEGAYPAELSDLISETTLDAKHLVCPSSTDKTETCSYIYRGADLKGQKNLDLIVVHDRQENHLDDNRNVLFNDGQVTQSDPSDFEEFIQRDNKIRHDTGLPEKGPAGEKIAPQPNTK